MTKNNMDDKKFATCLNCMDGRVHLPTIHWIRENYNVHYIDVITEIGMDRVLSCEYYEIDSILRKVKFSVEKHNSIYIFIVGHYDCAGNPVNEETHKRQICMAVQRLKKLKSFCQIIGLWISGKWMIENIIEL